MTSAPITTMTPAEIRTRRQAMGLTQKALAERLGVTMKTVHRWEIDDPANPEARRPEPYLRLALDQLDAPAGQP